MSDRYAHLLSPIRVGNVVLKSRLCQSKSSPHFLQGPEEYPAEGLISHYAGIARNGAAYVTVNPISRQPIDRLSKGAPDMIRAIELSDTNPANENYMSMCIDAIHFYGSLACVSLQLSPPKGYHISAMVEDNGLPEEMKNHILPHPPHESLYPLKEMSIEQLEDMKTDLVEQVKYYQELGFDMVNLYAPYTSGFLAGVLSPRINVRTDRYGGSAANRFRLIGEMGEAIKKACGQDFLVEVHLSCNEDLIGGFTAEDVVEYARAAEGKVDIFQIRGYNSIKAHPTGFTSLPDEDPMSLETCALVKKSGARVIVAGNGGYQDPDDIERYIAEGKMDMASMARSFICDFEYYKKLQQGRGDDVVPCVRCNRCHVPTMKGNWYSLCSVNPRMGIDRRLIRMVDATAEPQRVAVIGGGPAGMRAALFARERGHEVVLYEKTGYLGGQLIHAEYASFKWPLKRFRDWLVYQLDKQEVTVRLNTEPTREELRAEGFDAVIAATGAEAKMPRIEGADAPGLWTPIAVYGHEEKLGKNVIVVGGSETGAETALHLGELGHNVTVLTRKPMLAEDATPVHYIEGFRARWESLENFRCFTKVSTAKVAPDGVDYVDENGAVHHLEADSVVVCGGVRPRQEEAMAYVGAADKFYLIGDAKKPGNLHFCNRSAYAAAYTI